MSSENVTIATNLCLDLLCSVSILESVVGVLVTQSGGTVDREVGGCGLRLHITSFPVSPLYGQSLGLGPQSVSGLGATVSLWAWGHGQSGATVSLWAWGHGQSLGLEPRSVSGLGATVSLWATEISLYNIQPNTTHILQLTPRAD